MIQEKERLVSVGQIAGGYINYNGAIVSASSAFIVVKYEVSPGDKLTIHSTLHSGSSYSYAFYNSSEFSSANAVSVGPKVTTTSDDIEVTVPSGATYLGVQKYNSTEYVDKDVEISFKDINKLSQKSSVTGTEKIPVSDTEYITPDQIAALAEGGGCATKIYEIHPTELTQQALINALPSGFYNTALGDIENGIMPIICAVLQDGSVIEFKFDGYFEQQELISFSAVTSPRIYVFVIGISPFFEVIDLSEKESTSNKVTSLSSSSTDTEYPSAKCVYDLIGDIETILASI